jgi:hypothetical protein
MLSVMCAWVILSASAIAQNGSGMIVSSTLPAPPISTTRKTEHLTAKELARLQAAQQVVDKAQKELENVELSIKYAHGQRLGRTGWCDTSETVVDLWGDAALIESHSLPGCFATY